MNQVINLFSTPIVKKTLSLDIKEIQRVCYKIQSSTSGVINSNRNGWQSDNVSNVTNFKPLYTEILNVMNEYKDEVGAVGDVNIDNIWININAKGGSNITHNHPHCFMSGVYYVSTPKDCGFLYFENPSTVNYNWLAKHFKDYSTNTMASDVWQIEAKENDLYVFPSWAKHGVLSNMSNEDRISISFNGSLS